MSSSRRSARRPPAAVALVTLALVAAGCGNKKPPEPPLRLVPERATDLEVAQRGLELQFDFAYPAVTTSGQPLADLRAVELWRLVRPLAAPSEEEAAGADAPAAGDVVVAPATEPPPAPETAEPPTTPFLFVPPAAAGRVQAESRVQVDAREFLALAEVTLRIEGAELAAAISGDRILLRLPLGEPPAPAGAPDEELAVEVYAVTTESPKGLSSELSNLVKILPRVPPAPPAELDTRPSARGIEVAWQAEDPAIGFRVYRRDAVSRAYGEPIARPLPDRRVFLDTTARFGSRSVYTVTAVALESPLVESALATEREVDYQDRYPPTAPAGLIVLAEPGRVRLLWEPSDDADLAGYLVYRKSAAAEAFDRLTGEPTRDLGYLDAAVASGRSYSYYVSAVDGSGNESAASDTVDVTVP